MDRIPAPMTKRLPVRMCINCRSRVSQLELIRLQYLDSMLVLFTKNGRSFYLCSKCLSEKSLQKKISQTLRIPNEKASELCVKLKELVS